MESSDQKMALLQEYGSGTVGEQTIAECLVPHVCFLSSGLLSCLSGGNLETRVGYRYYFSEKRANTQRLQQFRLLQVAAKRYHQYTFTWSLYLSLQQKSITWHPVITFFTFEPFSSSFIHLTLALAPQEWPLLNSSFARCCFINDWLPLHKVTNPIASSLASVCCVHYTSNHSGKASRTLGRMIWDCHLPTSFNVSMGHLWQRVLQIKMRPQMLLI